MTASHNFMGHDNDKNQLEMEWKAGKRQQFPPPEALPAYVNRALPPRPNDSNSPSSSDSPEKNTQPQTASNPELLVSQHEDGRQNPDTTGMLNDAGLAMVQPLQLTTSSVPQFRQKQQRPPTIASPQPRYPAFMVLEVDERDEDIVSPVSAPLSGNNTHQQHEVSPISPVESERSIHSKVSDLDNASSESPDSPSIKDGSNSSRSGSRENQTEQSPSDQAITPLWYLEHQIQQINLRYSDPGSPISGAVVHPPSSFPSDPNLRRLRDSVASHSRSHSNSGSSTYSVYSPTSPKNNISLPLPLHNQFLYQPHSALRTPPQLPPPSRAASGRKRDSGVKLASPVTGSGASPPKVAFAGAGAGIGAKTDGFSVTRARANSSKRTAPPPPPLKLSERPLVDKYVKTPFPGLEEERRVKAEIERKGVEGGKGVGGEKERERERQRTPLHRKSASEGDGKGGSGVSGGGGVSKSKSKNDARKNRNRVSSLPGRLGLGGLARSLMSVRGLSRSNGDDGGTRDDRGISTSDMQAAAQKENGGAQQEGKAENGPKRMKSILSKAKQLGLGHGLGMGVGSEESRREKRRAEIKRQIRVGEPR